MGRIRSIHPEQWTDDDFCSLGPAERLLALALRNVADDNGIFPWQPGRLRLQLFPADPYTADEVAAMLERIEQANQVRSYEADGRRYGVIRSFVRYQKPRKPTFTHPAPPDDVLGGGYALHDRYGLSGEPRDAGSGADSDAPVRNQCGTGAELPRPEGRGEERRGEQRSGGERREVGLREESPPDGGLANGEAAGVPNCPHEAIVACYHETLPELPKVRVWTEARQRALRSLWRQQPRLRKEHGFRDFFRFVRKSDFLMGRLDGRADRQPFQADLEWLIKPSNFAKVVEGKYHERPAA